jgi:hypothetical protein
MKSACFLQRIHPATKGHNKDKTDQPDHEKDSKEYQAGPTVISPVEVSRCRESPNKEQDDIYKRNGEKDEGNEPLLCRHDPRVLSIFHGRSKYAVQGTLESRFGPVRGRIQCDAFPVTTNGVGQIG